MLWMMASTGIRRRKMWMLTKGDSDWDRSVIRVVHGKGQKERQIPIDRRCQRVMLRYMHQRRDSLSWLRVIEEETRLAYDNIWQDLNRVDAIGDSAGRRQT